MMTFSLLVSFAAISILLQRPKPIRLQKPAVLLGYLKSAAQIFGMVSLAYLFSWAIESALPSYVDLTPGLMLIMVFLLGKIFQIPGPLWVMVFCVWAYLETQAVASALTGAAIISLGVPFIEWTMDGIRFRLAFTASAKAFSALPGLLMILSLVALVGSGFFMK